MIFEATEVTVVLSAQSAYEPAKRVFLVPNTSGMWIRGYHKNLIILFLVRYNHAQSGLWSSIMDQLSD